MPDNNLITILGLEALPDDKKAETLERATDLIQKRLMLRFLESLDEADKARAEAAADDPEAFQALMVEKMPNLQEVMAEEVERLKDEMMLAALEEPQE